MNGSAVERSAVRPCARVLDEPLRFLGLDGEDAAVGLALFGGLHLAGHPFWGLAIGLAATIALHLLKRGKPPGIVLHRCWALGARIRPLPAAPPADGITALPVVGEQRPTYAEWRAELETRCARWRSSAAALGVGVLGLLGLVVHQSTRPAPIYYITATHGLAPPAHVPDAVVEGFAARVVGLLGNLSPASGERGYEASRRYLSPRLGDAHPGPGTRRPQANRGAAAGDDVRHSRFRGGGPGPGLAGDPPRDAAELVAQPVPGRGPHALHRRGPSETAHRAQSVGPRGERPPARSRSRRSVAENRRGRMTMRSRWIAPSVALLGMFLVTAAAADPWAGSESAGKPAKPPAGASRGNGSASTTPGPGAPAPASSRKDPSRTPPLRSDGRSAAARGLRTGAPGGTSARRRRRSRTTSACPARWRRVASPW